MTERSPLWAGLSDEEHEFQYNPQRAFPDFKDHQAARAPANAEARRRLRAVLDIPYGDHPLRRLDVFPAEGERSPVHVFIHGGYWRAQDKENFAFVADLFVAHGITAVVVNYELGPASTLDGVAESALAAFEWVLREIGTHGGDPGRVSLSGHSAGAHLGAEILAADWAARGLDPAVIRGAVLISGIFDPAPTMLTSVQADLHLTPEIVARRNVEARPIRVECPVAVVAGGREPWHWIDQSYRYAHHLHRAGRDPEVRIVPGFGHFDIINQYMDPRSPIARLCLAMAGREEPAP
jgi:arylformamidase